MNGGPVIPVAIGFRTASGSVFTWDPTVADTSCFGAANNVASTLTLQSPLFTPVDFNFGGDTADAVIANMRRCRDDVLAKV